MLINNHVESNDERQLIRIVDSKYGMVVHAVMPETMTIGVGADINSPFASFSSDGIASKVIALSSGASSKIGITTKRLFMGPDQPDISLDLKFQTYYSSYDEVLVPSLKLLLMGTGEERNIPKDFIDATKGFQKFNEVAADTLGKLSKGEKEKTTDLINYLVAPSALKVHFGDIFSLRNCLLSNVNVSFSNILDNDFLPMESSVSITLTPQDPLTKNEIMTAFKRRLAVRNTKANVWK